MLRELERDELKTEKKDRQIKIIEIAIIYLMLVSGSLYALYTLKNRSISLEVMKQYFFYTPEQINSEWVIFVFLWYLKKIMIVCVLGMISFFSMLSVAISMSYVFCYGFTMTIILCLFNIRASIGSIIIFVVQGVVLITYLADWCSHLVLNDLNKYDVIKGIVICIVISCLQIISY